MENAFKYAREKESDFENDLIEFLKIPSISTEPEFKNHVNYCAEWLSKHLKFIGVDLVETISTDGNPIIYGELIHSELAPTILIYGHYDVQPTDPISEWENDPFSPKIIEGNIYARGASDNKGQIFAILKAIESLIKSQELNVNLKIVIEGEEEIFSHGLSKFLDHNHKKLACDAILISDTAMYDNETPSIILSLRGSLSFEIILQGEKNDLHSGVYGGWVANPVVELSRIIGSILNGSNTIDIPGFYDEVNPVDASCMSEYQFINSLDIKNISGSLESASFLPSFDVTGISGGYQGTGNKSIIPSFASAKISIRLASNQNSGKIYKLVKQYIRENIRYQNMKLEFILHGSSEPVTINKKSSLIKIAKEVLNDTFDRSPAFMAAGGSIPIVSKLYNKLSQEIAIIGYGLLSDNIHAPNEHFGLDRFAKGIQSTIRFLHSYGRQIKN